MRTARWLAAVLLPLAACSPAARTASSPTDATARETALFQMFLPPSELSPAQLRDYRAAQTACSAFLAADPAMPALLLRFENLIRTQAGRPFAALDPAAREHYFANLDSSPDVQDRRLAAALRTRYLGFIYSSPLGLRIAGVDAAQVIPRLAPDAAAQVDAFRRRLPPSPLRYDAAARLLTATRPIDYIIIGSGPAGAVLAHELRRGHHTVLLIDKGPLVLPAAFDARSAPWMMDAAGARPSSDGGLLFRNAQAVGGGSAVNLDLAFSPTLPLIQHNIDAWRSAGALDPTFTPNRIAAAYGWVRDRLGTRTPLASEINANNQILWSGAQHLGLRPALYDLNTFAPSAAAPVTDKRSAIDSLLFDALTDPDNPLLLLPDAKAVRIQFSTSGGAALAVSVELEAQSPSGLSPAIVHDPAALHLPPHTHFSLAANTLILSAGSLGTASLLLNSDVPNPNIGRGIIAHPSLPLIGVFDHPIHALAGTPSTVYVPDPASPPHFILEATSASPAYVAEIFPGSGRDVLRTLSNFQNLAGFGVMLIDSPDPDNRIRLASDGQPIFDYHLGQTDKAHFRVAVATAVRILFQAGANHVLLPSTENLLHNGNAPLILTNPDQAAILEKNLDFTPGKTLLTSAHLQGSAKIGASPQHAVVSPAFHLFYGDAEVPNVYIMDSSIFPTSIGANPMQSTYTFAKLLADKLLPP